MSSFLAMLVMRSRHSWTSWRRSRATRRLAREVTRLALLQALELEQQRLVARLEGNLPSEAKPPRPPSPRMVFRPVTAPESLPDQTLLVQPDGTLEPTPGSPGLDRLTALPEQEDPDPQGTEEVARLIGLDLRPSSSRSFPT